MKLLISVGISLCTMFLLYMVNHNNDENKMSYYDLFKYGLLSGIIVFAFMFFTEENDTEVYKHIQGGDVPF